MLLSCNDDNSILVKVFVIVYFYFYYLICPYSFFIFIIWIFIIFILVHQVKLNEKKSVLWQLAEIKEVWLNV